MSEDLALELVIGTMVAIGAVGTHFAERARRRRDPLLGRPPTPIAAAGEGPVKIEGSVKLLDESFRAPFSGRPCAYWEVHITRHFTRMGEQQGAQQLVEDSRGFLFEKMAHELVVDDGAGTALVKWPPKAVLDFVVERNDYVLDSSERRAQIEWFLSHRGHHLDPRDRWSCRESALVAGERVAVHGLGHREPDPDVGASGGSYRERPTRLVVEPLYNLLRLSNARDVVGGPSSPRDTGDTPRPRTQ